MNANQTHHVAPLFKTLPIKGAEEITISLISENACLLTWPEKICALQHQQILRCEQAIKSHLDDVIVDTVVAYNSLMIYYHFMALPAQHLMDKVSQIIEKNKDVLTHKTHISEAKTIEIPVYFGEDMAWDLPSLSKTLKLSQPDIISLFTQASYQAYAMGFTPGFCYLGSINQQLQLARKATPRMNIPAGAVAIAEEQTAIYPTESPGGWHIIGRTPLPMYQVEQGTFTPTISLGDTVKFTEISQQTFNELTLKHAQSLGDNKS